MGTCSGGALAAGGGVDGGAVRAEEVHQQLRPGGPVHGAVMDLREEREAPLREPLDDPRLPERSRAVERRAVDAAADGGELAWAARRGARDAPHVVDDVEVRILDPDRVVQVEGHAHEAPVERRQQVEPARDEVLDLLERVAARHA